MPGSTFTAPIKVRKSDGTVATVVAADGTISGASGNATQLQGRNVSNTAPPTGALLQWNGTAWVPYTDPMPLLYATVTLDRAGIVDMWTNGVDLVAAPGANKIIVPELVQCKLSQPENFANLGSGTSSLRSITLSYGKAPGTPPLVSNQEIFNFNNGATVRFLTSHYGAVTIDFVGQTFVQTGININSLSSGSSFNAPLCAQPENRRLGNTTTPGSVTGGTGASLQIGVWYRILDLA